MSEKKKQQPFWIKERHNPQLGVYYVACGQMSKTAAKNHEKPLYGSNIMHEYETEEAYQDRLAELLATGKSVQG